MRMNCKLIMARFAVMLAAVLLLASCAQKFNEIQVTSWDVKSFSPKGLRSADIILSLGVDNPARTFTVRDCVITVKDSDTRICEFTADSLTVNGKTEMEYVVPFRGRMESFNVMELMQMAASSQLSDFTADFSARVSTGKGKGRKVEFSDIKLTELFK